MICVHIDMFNNDFLPNNSQQTPATLMAVVTLAASQDVAY